MNLTNCVRLAIVLLVITATIFLLTAFNLLSHLITPSFLVTSAGAMLIIALLVYVLGRQMGMPIDWILLPNSGKNVGDCYVLVAIPARCAVAILMEYCDAKPKRLWIVVNYPNSIGGYLSQRFKKINNETTKRI